MFVKNKYIIENVKSWEFNENQINSLKFVENHWKQWTLSRIDQDIYEILMIELFREIFEDWDGNVIEYALYL